MIWACRLRFITYWMNVGRNTRYPAPIAVQTRLPSAFPMMASCRRFPLWVPKGFPGVRRIIRSSPFGSTRITVSPARSGPAGLRPSITAARPRPPSPSPPPVRAPRAAPAFCLPAPGFPPPPGPPPLFRKGEERPPAFRPPAFPALEEALVEIESGPGHLFLDVREGLLVDEGGGACAHRALLG